MSKSPVSKFIWRSPKSRESKDRHVENLVVPEAALLDATDETDGDVTSSREARTSLSPVTDSSGNLMRNRPSWTVPVGPRAAAQLSMGLTDRDVAILVAVEQLGMLTAEQIARSFFNTHRSAYERLLLLSQKRFLVNLGADPSIISRSVGHRSPPRNPVYALDWNGAYLLAYQHKYHLDNWRPTTAALITTRFGHNLGVSEVWSFLMAAARASHEPGDGSGYTLYELALAFRNERHCLISSSVIKRQVAPSDRGNVLLQPDAALVLEISHQLHGHAPAQDVNSASPRWSNTLDSWRSVFLAHAPSTSVMLKSEKLAGSEPSSAYRPYYRTLLLEMETGTNDVTDTTRKIKGYNRVIRTNRDVWTNSYGQAPRVLVIVPTDRQLEKSALRWRLHYYYKEETAVLLSSLETLAKAVLVRENDAGSTDFSEHLRAHKGPEPQKEGRSSFLRQACWFDVMANRWRPINEVLGISVIPGADPVNIRERGSTPREY